MSIVTYEDAVKCIPDKIKGKVSLYDFVSFRDSLNGSHNNMSKTRSDRVKIEDIIERLPIRNSYRRLRKSRTMKRRLRQLGNNRLGLNYTIKKTVDEEGLSLSTVFYSYFLCFIPL